MTVASAYLYKPDLCGPGCSWEWDCQAKVFLGMGLSGQGVPGNGTVRPRCSWEWVCQPKVFLGMGLSGQGVPGNGTVRPRCSWEWDCQAKVFTRIADVLEN